jgi:cytochrome c peroxidase
MTASHGCHMRSLGCAVGSNRLEPPVPRLSQFPLRFARLLLPASIIALAALSPASRSAPATSVAAAPTSVPRSFYETPYERKPDFKTLVALGRALFSDRALSASGRVSCASCHAPSHAYGPPNKLPVQLGGPGLTLPGIRAVPSLTYHQAIPNFQEHFFDNDGNDSEDQGPTGGLDWDGRADSGHEQAAGPLLSPFEMANTDMPSVVARLKASPDAAAMRATFGVHVLDDPKLAWNGLLLALEVFQQSPADFYPYSSKYDAYLRGQVKLSTQEMRGLDVFNGKARGNCAACHISVVRRGAFPQFTDFGLIAIGVPRNRAIPANAKAGFRDLGACGPLRTDLQAQDDYCGLFRTPSLRNVATRGVFFHNGVYTKLEDAVRFYALRDSDPKRIYGKGRQFDDLPKKYQDNLNQETPFGAKPGDKPTMTEAEIADVVAFLKTLTDGYVVPARRQGRVREEEPVIEPLPAVSRAPGK